LLARRKQQNHPESNALPTHQNDLSTGDSITPNQGQLQMK
jgi:hypothetical protein